jgi:type II secretory pathway pseudopilin PulG
MDNPATSLPSLQHHRVLSEPEAGLTLIAVIGLLAMISVGLAVFSPSMVRVWNRNNQDIETRNLQMIANGIITYLRQNKAFPPSLVSLAPAYAPFSATQLTANAQGFPRYYVVHPSMAGFQNSTGLTAGELLNARFLLLSDLTQDVAPTITTPTEFETWWSTNESTTLNLLLHRENLGNLFYSLSITSQGNGASFSINHVSTDSNGALLPAHGGFHLIGTEIGFDEDNSYMTPDILFSLTTHTAYWFDPMCVAANRWNPLAPPC